MTSRRAAKKAWEPDPSGADRISALPDAVLQHALGFLPAREAVQTCVLARRWRHLWRSLPRLRITDVAPPRSAVESESVHRFVNGLLMLRDPRSALDLCEIRLPGSNRLFDPIYVDIWIQRVLSSRVRELHLDLEISGDAWLDWHLASSYLKVLHLHGVDLVNNVLDFSECPVLEDLQIICCNVHGDEIWAPSSKRLTMVDCTFNPDNPDCSLTISAPSLISLKLEDWVGTTPLIECMPSLQTASVMYDCCFSADPQKKCFANYCDCCPNCYDNSDRIGGCVLLGGLSNARHLKFKASYGMVTFKRDLEHCPTFNKLKTLRLIDWCSAGDLQALLGFLQHTPNLEKLTLQLCQRDVCGLEMQDNNQVEQSFSLKKLKKVKIRCAKIDERVQRILQVLNPIGVGLKEFNIKKI